MDTTRHVGRLRAILVLLVVLTGSTLAISCRDDYRVGEYVWVTWEGRDYPAYIIEQRGKTRYRVHYDGYDTRWDEDVTGERVKGRVKGPATPPPPPEKVARAMGLRPKPSSSSGVTGVYNVGDRVRVRWRGSSYTATVVAPESAGRVRVHYEGYGPEWDEVVPEDRVSGKH